jgi:predicted nucleic acid-binding protein
MIILDTNVISELMRAVPNPSVMQWLNGCHPTEIAITSITQSEILYGLSILDDGQRKESLLNAAFGLFEDDFAERIFPFDAIAATQYADIAALRRRSGRPISQADAQIAAIVRSTNSVLATRNVDDFVNCGIEVVDPF